ncbi:MAG: YjhG/YagF family D-xylonate dehydratase, partial [Thermoguttaceae bacterium]|nr:YjhG/YagF family D-xylonate dehydratase [Thermoguttaceae bacterium]MDW8039012.1 YjhG/YagF family D-xylonate dehydratase [Thermoguttaceae bacterium]
CDGRTQGHPGMFDSLAYRNDAAIVFRRLARSLPGLRGLLAVGGCDKSLPAMLMALSSLRDWPSLVVPAGVTLPTPNAEDTAEVQTLGARFARGEISLQRAAEMGCRACGSAGGSCQFLGTAATGQVLAEAMGLTLPHAALTPSGQPIWLDLARRSARALMDMDQQGLRLTDILTPAALRNAMVVFAAFGGSTNWILHLAAVAHAAGLPRPSLEDWEQVHRQTPRLVSVLPNGPVNHPTVRVWLAGGVPEVMLWLRELGLLELDALTVSGLRLGQLLDWWAKSPRRHACRRRLQEADGVDPNQVIFGLHQAQQLGLGRTLCFPRGNLAPEGSVIKSTAIDPRVLDADGVYRKTGPVRVFCREADAIAAIKGIGPRQPIRPGDVLVLVGLGPLGAGMPEIYQITGALKHLSWGHEVAVLTDGRFSGVSTGACIGLIAPEALAGGPIGKLRDGDRVCIVVDPHRLEGRVDLVGDADRLFSAEEAAAELRRRPPHPELAPDPRLSEDTQLWALLQNLSGGPWAGCVYDLAAIRQKLSALYSQALYSHRR